MVQPLWRTAWRFLKRLQIELSYDPTIPLLGIYPEKMKTLIWKGPCAPAFITTLFTVAKIWKQPKYPSTDKWLKKVWGVGVWVGVCNRILAIKTKQGHVQQHGWA